MRSYKSLRNKLIAEQGPGLREFKLTANIRAAINSIVWEHESMQPVINEEQGTVTFVHVGNRMQNRYPITYANFLHFVDISKVGEVAGLYTSPDQFFDGLVVQEDQRRRNGTIIKAGSGFESDLRRWVCVDYYGDLDREKLICPWWYDEQEECYQLMLHDGNSGLNKLRKGGTL